MLKILNDFELNFIEFLNKKHFTEEVVKLSILHNYESVGGDDENGFAVYIPELKTIMLPTETPDELSDMKEFVIHNLAHEYKHFLQDVNGEEFNEEEADQFADEIVNEYLNEVNLKGENKMNKIEMNKIKESDIPNEGYIPNGKKILGEEVFNKLCEKINELDKETLKKSIELIDSLTSYISSNNHVFLEKAYLDARDIILNELAD